MKQNAMRFAFPTVAATLVTILQCVNSGRIEVDGGSVSSAVIVENMISEDTQNLQGMTSSYISNNATTAYRHDPLLQMERFKKIRDREMKKVDEKAQERKLKARNILKKLPQPKARDLERVTDEQLENIKEQHKQRGLGWFRDGSTSASGVSVSSQVLADSSSFYDKWAQAYRMLGGFIDCDYDKSENNHHSGDEQQQSNSQNSGAGCSRWMLWASYVNPNYQGNEYDEYFGNNPTSFLDCHSPDTEWILLGVYRQEFYQYVEQISKHLWAIDEYEYVVALAGLAYMTKYECFQVGKNKYGDAVKASVNPLAYGKWEIALYTDQYCLTPDTSLGMTYDDFGLGSSLNLGSKDKNNGDYSDAYTWWSDAQEYTLTSMNDVYEDFKYCTSCVDYPTYQDGYFIGDYGTDDDDLINQCWKFYSHSSYTCEADCIAQAHAQGTILSVKYGDTVFGKTDQSFYEYKAAMPKGIESPLSRLAASAFLSVSFVLFIATFLAFAVARRSRYRENRSSKRQRLLDPGTGEDGRVSSSKSRRSKSKVRDGDGIYRGESSRSKSKDRRAGSSSRRSSSQRRRSRSISYDSPKESKARRSSTRNDDY